MSYTASVLQEAGAAGAASALLTFSSRRSPMYGRRGMVAASQPLAAEAGLRVLQRGGNAADAAIAVGAALGVLEPHSSGIGGDAFALFYDAASKRVACLQGNGASPAGLTLQAVRAAGVTGLELPPRSALAVTVPGAVALWETAAQQWGSLPLAELLGPAIELAEGGFPVAPVTAHDWAAHAGLLAAADDGSGAARGSLLDADGRPPMAGQMWTNGALAAVYRRIAEQGAREGFYSGPVADAMVAAVASRGGVLTHDDLAAHATLQVEPLSTSFRGHTVWEVPPPAAGVVALMALNMLEVHAQQQQPQQQQQPKQQPQQQAAPHRINFGAEPALQRGWEAPGDMHAAVEALRLAFADGLACVADPRAAAVPVEEMLCMERAQKRYSQYFNPEQVCQPAPCDMLPGVPRSTQGGDTVQWVGVDGDGNAASFIQSTYMAFGTGITPEGCGFTLQNRGYNFVLEPGHPNSLAPRTRPYHTIIPGMLTDATTNDLVAAFGCMGGFMQPQGHVQLLLHLLDRRLDPQAALDVPRFCIGGVDSAAGPSSVLTSSLLLEEGLPQQLVDGLAARGHNVRTVSGPARSVFGKGTIIAREPASGVLCGGVDPRSDGAVVAW